MNTAAVETSMRIHQAELQSPVQTNLNSAIIPHELIDSLPVIDISDQIRETVLHLQRDLDGVSARVRSLEVSALSGSLHNSVVSDYKLINCTYSPGEKSGFKMLCVNYWRVFCPGTSRYETWSESIWTDAVKQTIPNLPWWMSPLHCRLLLLWFIFLQGLFYCWKHLSYTVLGISQSCCITSSLIVLTSSNCLPFTVYLFWGKGYNFKEVFICFCTLSKSEVTDRWCSCCCAVSSHGMIIADMSHAEICH